jgi:hypothetical protein
MAKSWSCVPEVGSGTSAIELSDTTVIGFGEEAPTDGF